MKAAQNFTKNIFLFSVTSFCKVIQDSYGQIKSEIVTENEAVLGNSSTNTTNFVNIVNEPLKNESEEEEEEEIIDDPNAGQNGFSAVSLPNNEEKIDTHKVKDEETVVYEEEIVNSLKDHEDNLQKSKFIMIISRKKKNQLIYKFVKSLL